MDATMKNEETDSSRFQNTASGNALANTSYDAYAARHPFEAEPVHRQERPGHPDHEAPEAASFPSFSLKQPPGRLREPVVEAGEETR